MGSGIPSTQELKSESGTYLYFKDTASPRRYAVSQKKNTTFDVL